MCCSIGPDFRLPSPTGFHPDFNDQTGAGPGYQTHELPAGTPNQKDQHGLLFQAELSNQQCYTQSNLKVKELIQDFIKGLRAQI